MEAVKILLCYGQQKKVVVLRTADERALHSAVSEAFDLHVQQSQYVLQSFDHDFDEFVKTVELGGGGGGTRSRAKSTVTAAVLKTLHYSEKL